MTKGSTNVCGTPTNDTTVFAAVLLINSEPTACVSDKNDIENAKKVSTTTNFDVHHRGSTNDEDVSKETPK